MIEAVVFDLGGPLIEYAGTYESWPELETPGMTAVYHHLTQNNISLPDFNQFRDRGFAILPDRWQQAVRQERNLTVADFLTDLLAQLNVPPLADRLLDESTRRYQQAIQDQAWVLPNAAETIKQIKSAGYKVGLLSNTMFCGEAHKADLARFELLDYFDELLFSSDVGKWKPNADPFLQLLDALGVEAETAVYVGDDPTSDVLGGQRAGMKTVYVKSTQRFHKPNGVEPDAEINQLKELIQILQKWRKQGIVCRYRANSAMQ